MRKVYEASIEIFLRVSYPNFLRKTFEVFFGVQHRWAFLVVTLIMVAGATKLALFVLLAIPHF